MGDKPMSDVTDSIMVVLHNPKQIFTMLVNGAAELYPGWACTCDGETADTRDIAKPSALGHSTFGIVLCPDNHDIDTVLDDDQCVQVSRTGSGNVVKAVAKLNYSAKMGDRMSNTGAANDGYLIPTVEILAGSATLFTHILQHAGVAYHDYASLGSQQPFDLEQSG